MVECGSLDATLQYGGAMTARLEREGSLPEARLDGVTYIRNILPELTDMARRDRAEMLVFLLEMAFTEASDLLSGRSESLKVDRNQAARMAMKPAGKI